ncbi:MAG: 2,3-epoxybenzoyl-CoA dihydrolase [Acidimicrobiales bacterium]
MIDFATEPSKYHHWTLDVDGEIATLTMSVDPAAGLRDDYELKTNSYDLGVDIELHDVVQRLRFEHPSVKVAVLTGGLDKIFCAGANIQMLAGATHEHKVNFCKFTNETRNSIEDATSNSQQIWLAAVNGTAAGGGYELALACDEILLIDDRSSAVSLPEIPLLAVLPGTGGLTRLVEKRHVRRDLADAFATRSEGVRGQTALDWNLVDYIAPASIFGELITSRTTARAHTSDRPDVETNTPGVALTPLERTSSGQHIGYSNVTVEIDRGLGTATISIAAPRHVQPGDGASLAAAGDQSWLLRTARELDDAILHLRFNETSIGTWVFTTTGDTDAVAQAEAVMNADPDHWLVREVHLFWTRVLKRLDVSARTLITAVEPGSCFCGILAELLLVADRSFMLEGTWEDDDDPPPAATIQLTAANRMFPMSNGLTRLETRFWQRPDALKAALDASGIALDAAASMAVELVTFTPDDLDWHDELRLTYEERNSFSPDALTAMEANYRFVGPETMETKIFSRLSAWQNWIFQRPNAVGPQGALQRFGTGSRPSFDNRRV